MKATDIIRGVLDLIDRIDHNESGISDVAIVVSPEEQIQTGVDTNRFKHIYAMLDAERSSPTMYDNSPNEIIASLDAVTKDAGGGWNGPKNPTDIRADSISMYPNHLHKPE